MTVSHTHVSIRIKSINTQIIGIAIKAQHNLRELGLLIVFIIVFVDFFNLVPSAHAYFVIIVYSLTVSKKICVFKNVLSSICTPSH